MSSTHNFNYLTPEDEELACLHAMQLTNSSAFPMVLTAAVDLGVLEIIAKAGQDAYISPSDIAAQLPTNNKDASIMLDRMLSLIASHQVLSCTLRTLADGKVERLYGLTPVCKFLVKNEDGVCMAPLVLLNQDKVFLESWYHLKNAVLDGGNPFAKAFGMRISEYWGTDSRFNSLFSKGMSDHSVITMKKILETYKGFEGVKSVVDVGGGTGGAISMIASKHPTIQAINFDLPPVVEIAPKYPGVKHIGGDMFVSIPKGEAMFLKYVLHGLSDEPCLQVLKKCREALPDNGKVIIVESILPVLPEPTLLAKVVYQLDNIMLSISPSGKERTKNDFEALSLGAGFAEFKVAFTAFNCCVMEFYKMI